jgi:hypothetical protein
LSSRTTGPAIGEGQGLEKAVVAGDEDPVLPSHRRKTHGAPGEEAPADATAGRVECIDLIVGRTAEDHQIADQDGLEGKVELHTVGSRPGRLRRRRQAELPALAQLIGDDLGRVTTARGIAAVSGPVGGDERQGQQAKKQGAHA